MIRRLVRRRAWLPRPLRIAIALLCGGLAVFGLAGTGSGPSASAQFDEALGPVAAPTGAPPDEPLVRAGRRLFVDTCASCHGMDARGIPGRAPSLYGAGALSADFYLRTGRMPLTDPEDQPLRSETALPDGQIRALVAYVGTLGGPPIPDVDVEEGDIALGQRLFTENCAACHQVMGRGGIVTRAVVPDLIGQVTPLDVAEAIEIGPYVMPLFPWMSDEQVNSIARYVAYADEPTDVGGWGIGHLGPVPEGMVTWLLAMAALMFAIRLIGERTTA